MEFKCHERSPLNRSLSTPDISANEPICRKVYMEEYYYRPSKNHAQGESPMIRHISCQQLIGHGIPPNRNFVYGGVPFDEISKFPSANTLCLETSAADFHDSPMDVDQETSMETSNLLTEMNEVIAVASTPNALSKCKVKYRGQVPILIKEPEETVEEATVQIKSGWFSCWLTVAVICLISGLCYIPYYDKLNYQRKIQLDAIKNDLLRNVKYQKQQVQQIVTFMDKVDMNMLSTPDNFLALIGPTGVGKSLCGNLIKKNFKENQVFDVDKNNFILDAMSFHRNMPYLVIIDNLSIEDLQAVTAFLDSLARGPTIYVIAIFNTQDLSDDGEYSVRDSSPIPKHFDNTNYRIHSVLFDKISKEEVLEYAKDKPDYDSVKPVIEEHSFDEYGFKGFRAKLNILQNPRLNLIF